MATALDRISAAGCPMYWPGWKKRSWCRSQQEGLVVLIFALYWFVGWWRGGWV